MRSITTTLTTMALLAVANPALAGTARSWSAAMQAVPTVNGASALPPLGDTTIRQIMRLSVGGDSLRLTFDNSDSPNPLLIDHIEVAQVDAAGRILPGTSQRVTVGDRPAVVIPAHAPMVSDVVKMALPPLARVAISIHLAAGQQPWSFHGYAAANTLLAPGDQTTAPELTSANAMQRRFLVSGIDVISAKPLRSVVAFGDSITDGVRATVDSDRRWPDQLAGRLQQAGMTQVGVANQGISGNKVLQDGAGIGALARFDRDVLGVPGVSHVIVLEGVNDIGGAFQTGQQASFDAVALINAYRQMVLRAHDHGIKVLLATILPYKGAGYWSAWGEEQRTKVNAWIRSQREADGMVDLDAAVRNPADPQAFAPAYDSGDHLHPNDAGFTAMAKAVPLNLLR
ncbi:SGNH/GDSL hydrolase family protein [Novosphingobium rosa]|uniref:SGNH/GDSL hydrolase family protein n=1 Tax=Novosphingobium rosa TaxID=76978 RepID=UPI00083252F2|nr:SGNH/GDSL hydrolase family protein [Novosphingobium rosa]